jgi:hypothetical protein
MSETSSTSDETKSDRSERRGEVDVCPVCGSGVHPQAYFCSRCSNYFCFVCRSRVSSNDVSLQCVNRDCDYFGKLVCSHCDPATAVSEKPFVYKEPTDGYWPAWLLACALVSIYLVWRTTWIAGGLAFLSLYAGLGYLLQSVGFNIFGKERSVELTRTSTKYSCVRCSQPVKTVTFSKKS